MPPSKPNPALKKEIKVTIIPPSRKRRKTFFEEYYYGVLAAECILVSLVVGGAGMGFYRGTLVGLLVAALTSVLWQFRQLAKFKDDPRVNLRLAPPKPALKPIRPAKRAPAPVGPDGKKIFPPSYFPPLRDKKTKQ
ncbi:MAG TPA: hypothetical protein VKP58_17250 [Candidatus Acidoferrum sp.]|nr:hypothetical protein [Candidatus Acidoferrum sp.]